jgi:hypothetical protein
MGKRLKYIADIVLTEEQIERYTKELASDEWKIHYEKRCWIFSGFKM